MNKTSIKNFSVWARRKLIADITYRAGMLGITEKAIARPLPQSTADLQLFDVGLKEPVTVSGSDIRARKDLVEAINEKARETTQEAAFHFIVEKVAYTWFNRLIAIRFMEVNGYLPSGTRVLSSELSGKAEPDIVTTPFETDLVFTTAEADTVQRLKDENRLDELFRLLFIKQCKKLHEILPYLFEQTDSYAEMLLTISFTDKDGIVRHLVQDIPEEDFNVTVGGQVEIIGWLYQYWNTEPKDQVFANLKKNIKISKDNIPAATQLFTPDWIVKYMVENSLGRIFVEWRVKSGEWNEEDRIAEEQRIADQMGWKYYLPEAAQEPEVRTELTQLRQNSTLNSELSTLKVIDPCMGSGHILIYMFDVLMQIYESQGWTQRDAAQSILRNNLYGLDIDDRAAQLAYFAVMMKARQYDRRILTRNLLPNVFAIQESNTLRLADLRMTKAEESVAKKLCALFMDAKEYGSILTTKQELLTEIDALPEDAFAWEGTMFAEQGELLTQLCLQARMLGQKYTAVCTNPPYLGNGNMSSRLSLYLKQNYVDGRNDLFAVFILRCLQYCEINAFQAMITQHQWMFLSSYLEVRDRISLESVVNMTHLGARAFDEINGEVVQTTSFVIRKTSNEEYIGKYIRLTDVAGEIEKSQSLFEKEREYRCKTRAFKELPGNPYVYWIGRQMSRLFTCPTADSVVDLREGIHTGQNELFIRYWTEIDSDKLVLNAASIADVDKYGVWVPYNKGGSYRKWYGNNELVIGFDRAHRDAMASLSGHVRPSQSLYFKEGGTWSALASGKFGLRYYPRGHLFDSKGQVAVGEVSREIITLFNLKAYQIMADMLMPTLDYKCGDVKKLPYCHVDDERFLKLGDRCIQLSREEYDCFEMSWDFRRHPLICVDSTVGRVEVAWRHWESICNQRFDELRANEEELNRIFINIYSLQDELTPEVEDKDVTVRKANLTRDIKSLISYAVGCMFGRYSLDEEGLAYAGGEWDRSKYHTYVPDDDNCLPITDEDYGLKDDVVNRFIDFIRTVYGAETLEENLAFIANALGNTGATPRETIRKYFLTDFFKDHCQTYSVTGSGKRPIYWLFDSGKANGFKALVYMHRWTADTVGNLRVEYLHRMQRVYDSEIVRMTEEMEHGATARDRNAAAKRRDKLLKQLKETRDYDTRIAHIALTRPTIDLDDGVKVNYEKVQRGPDGKSLGVLAKI